MNKAFVGYFVYFYVQLGCWFC